MHNFWVDLDMTIKSSILKKAVENGWLSQEFVKDFVKGDEEDALRKEKEKRQEKR
jgi:hypothetical protein